MTLTKTDAYAALLQLLDTYKPLRDADKHLAESEEDVKVNFVIPLLQNVLGYPVGTERVKFELQTEVGRPDITVLLESGEKVYIEVKRFGRISDIKPANPNSLEKVLRPTDLPNAGMAVDRSDEENQTIRYAYAEGGEWAILTNFEKFRVFNARRDWTVISFEDPYSLKTSFDDLWDIAYPNVNQGSLERLNAQRYQPDIDNDYLQFIKAWREKLAADILKQGSKNPWVWRAEGIIHLPLLRAVVQRLLDRLVMIRFAEDHLAIRYGTLREHYDLRRRNPYTLPFYQTLNQILFREFDKEHNSALFMEDTVDQAVLSDEVLMPLVDELYKARYRSMPADILGNTYEQYLGTTLHADKNEIKTRDNLETRKKQGSYYTPQVLVQYLVDQSLGRYLYATDTGKPTGQPLPDEARKTWEDIQSLRVLDNACGSGSFLIYAYQVLAEFYESEIVRLNRRKEDDLQALAAQGVSEIERIAAGKVYDTTIRHLRNYPHLILERHLYGVDLDPQAAEIAVVNLMMRAMERRYHEKRLPLILNQNVKVGNSLIGFLPTDSEVMGQQAALMEVRRLREDLITTNPTPDQHSAAIRTLQAKLDDLNAQLQPAWEAHFSDLSRIRPFHWGVEFPEVFYDAEGNRLADGGFTIVFGNPPWEILKPEVREFYAQFDAAIESKLKRREVEARIADLDEERPDIKAEYEAKMHAIEQMGVYIRHTPHFTHQGRGDTATHKLFLERAYTLLRQEGRLGYVVPSGIYTDLGTKELREMLLSKGHIDTLISLTNGLAGGAAYFPSIHRSFKITLLVTQKGVQKESFKATFRVDPRITPHPDDLLAFAANPDNFIEVNRTVIERFSPDSLSLMEFQTRRDYEIAEKIYDGHPLLGETVEGSWNVKLTNEFHMTNDRHLFNTVGRGLPLYEGKMIHQYNAFFAEPQYWIASTHVEKFPPEKQAQLNSYRVVHRRIARSTDERTLISAIVPPGCACEVNATVVLITPPPDPLPASGEGESSHTPDHNSPSPFTERGLGGEVSESPFTERGLGGEVSESPLTNIGFSREVSETPWYTNHPLWKKLKPLAREMRHNPTPAEDALWQRLRNKQLDGMKFRRQHTIDRFIVDFYCSEAKLIIEIDGDIHQYTVEEDAIRQAFLETSGFRVIRFSNEDVLKRQSQVLATIRHELRRPRSPSPFTERGLGGEVSETPFTERGLGGEVSETWSDQAIKVYVCAMLNTFVIDSIIRYKISTTLNMFFLQQLPLPRLQKGNPFFDKIVARAAKLMCSRVEFAALWEEVMGTAWVEAERGLKEEERRELRDEIDALVAHLYGLSRRDFDHILHTFPLVFPDTEIGRRKRETLLAIYDEMAAG